MVGVSLALFATLEVSLAVAFAVRGRWHVPAPNFRGEADTYADRNWARAYYRDLDRFEQARTIRWSPYVYWRRVPYQSNDINITADGLRRTVNVAPPTAGRETRHVFMFGGSTMWGLGAGDDSTLPSLVAQELHRLDPDVPLDFTNFGQYAYVSTQGLLELTRQLQEGHIPDLVVFLDGVNDTFAAFQLGVPGLPFDEHRREMELNLSVRPEVLRSAAQYVASGLSTTRLVNGLGEALGLRDGLVRSIPLQYEQQLSDRATLARAVVDTYFNNIRLVQALADSYGFATLFYWQPVIYLKPHLSAYERESIDRDFNYPGMKDFYLQTYDSVGRHIELMERPPRGFHDISRIFSEIREPMFVDFNHMGDRGNRVIARRIADDLVVGLKTRSIIRRQSHGVESGNTSNASLLDLSAVERR
jgi:lysophospholipase L1-like esterase